MSEQTKPWFESRLPIAETLNKNIASHKLPRDLPYSATLGALITGALIFLTASGLVLSVYYNPWHAFDSIQFITREVNYGWLIHGFHETGTTMLFATIYLLLFRALLNREYKAPGELVWFLKLVLFAILLLAGYLGYTLSDGAMSYWSLHESALAAARMGGLPGALGTWFFGGPYQDSTLIRIAILHGALAILAFLVLVIHLAAKRSVAKPPQRSVSLHPYYTSQYFVSFIVFALIFAVLLFFSPHFGENPLNQAAPAGGLVVPSALISPWYLLPIDGIANAAGSPTGQIIAVIAAIAVLFALPWLDLSKPNTQPGFWTRSLAYILALDVIALCLTETAGASALSSILSTVFIFWYFFHFIVLTPIITAAEAK